MYLSLFFEIPAICIEFNRSYAIDSTGRGNNSNNNRIVTTITKITKITKLQQSHNSATTK